MLITYIIGNGSKSWPCSGESFVLVIKNLTCKNEMIWSDTLIYLFVQLDLLISFIVASMWYLYNHHFFYLFWFTCISNISRLRLAVCNRTQQSVNCLWLALVKMFKVLSKWEPHWTVVCGARTIVYAFSQEVLYSLLFPMVCYSWVHPAIPSYMAFVNVT